MLISKPIEILGNLMINSAKSIVPIVEFIGQCVSNLLISLKYLLTGKVNFKNTLQQAAMIGYDSIGISLVIIFTALALTTMNFSIAEYVDVIIDLNMIDV